MSFATGDGFDDEEIEVTGPAPVIDFVFSNFIYTPSQDSNAGTLDFQVTIPGQAPQTSNATVTISPVADAPVALPDLNRVSTDEASPVTTNFTAFDPDPGDTLTYQMLSQPTRGTVTPDGSGGFTFDPAGAFEDVGANQTVTVFFTYQATDQTGLTSQPATVSITVSGINDAPTAPATNTVAIDEDTASSAIAIGAADVEGDPLTFVLKTGFAPTKGTVAFDQVAGTFTYTPNANENGSDTFTIEVSDGQGGAPTEQVVSVTINPVNDPIAVQSDFQIVGAGQTTTIDVLANDTDIDGTATLGLPSSTSARGAALSVNPAGGIDYTPLPGDIGFDEFEYTLTDDDGTVLTTFATVGVEPTATVGQTITGTPNDDFLVGTLGDDTIFGLDGFDELVGSRGNDQIDGGGSFANDDSLAFAVYVAEVGGSLLNGSFVQTGVTVTWNSLLGATATDTYGDTDTLSNIVDVEGTFGADVFDASGVNAAAIAGEPNYFTFVIPYAGADTILGNTGFNIVSYTALVEDTLTFGPVSGINANLATGIIIDPWGDRDTVTNIEAVYGTQFVDTFTGVDGGFSRFRGLDGVDIYNGTATGIEEIDFRFDAQNGGTGNIVVDLGAGTATDGFGNNETFSDIDRVRGGRTTDDDLTGSDGDNRLRGEGGNDNLDGGRGSDSLQGGSGNDTLTAGDELTDLRDQVGNNLQGNEGDDTLIAGRFSFTGMVGGEGNDTFEGRGTFSEGFNSFISYIDEDGPFGVDVEFIAPGIAEVNDTFNDGSLRPTDANNTQNVDTARFAHVISGTAENDTLVWDDAIGGFGPTSDEGIRFHPYGGMDFIDVNPNAFQELRYADDVFFGSNSGITVFWDRADNTLFTDTWGNTDPWGNPLNGTFGVVLDPSGDVDLFSGIAFIQGTPFDDVVFGDAGTNFFQSWGGNDIFNAGDGFDFLDLASFGAFFPTNGFNVDINAGVATNGGGSTVNFSAVEGIIGSQIGDEITGNNLGNVLIGNQGDDVLDGFGGAFDRSRGDSGADTFVISANYGRADVNEAPAIEDFTLGEDVIGLADGLLVSDLTVQQVGTETHITIVDNSGDGPVVLTLARLENVDAAALIAAQSDDDTAYDPAVIFNRPNFVASVGIDDNGLEFMTDENVNFTTGSVLANDLPSTFGQTLTVTGLDLSATSGSVINNGDGTFFYNPDGFFDGLVSGENSIDTFTYTFTDDFGSTGSALVTITINGVDSPVGTDDDGVGFTTDAATAFTTANVLVNDVPGSNASSVFITGIDDLETLGLVTDNGDGTFEYDPAGAFDDLDDSEQSTDFFTYTFEDEFGATGSATVTITIDGVDDAPVTTTTDQFLTDDGDNDPDTFNEQTIELVDIFGDGSGIASFSDPDTADIPRIDISTISINGTTFTGFGDVILGIELVDGPGGPQLFFDNDENSGLKKDQIGRFTVEFQVTSDEIAGDGDPRVQAFLDIAGDDDAPEVFSFTQGETQAGTKDTPVTLDIREPVGEVTRFNALRDLDSETLTARLALTNPADGTLALNTGDDPKLTIIQSGAILEFSGPTSDVEEAFYSTFFTDDTITFTPSGDVNGDVTIDVTITDDTDQSDTEILTISLAAVNDIPTSQDNGFTVDEGSFIPPFNTQDFDFTDVEDADFTSIRIVSAPTNGQIDNLGTPIGDGDLISFSDLSVSNVSYTPNASFTGADPFTFTVLDSEGGESTPANTFTITINPVNDPPTSSGGALTVTEDGSAALLSSSFNFADIDTNDSLQEIRIASLPTNGLLKNGANSVAVGDVFTVAELDNLELTYAPDLNVSGDGADSFTFDVSDGTDFSSVSATLTIDVTPVNDPLSINPVNPGPFDDGDGDPSPPNNTGDFDIVLLTRAGANDPDNTPTFSAFSDPANPVIISDFTLNGADTPTSRGFLASDWAVFDISPDPDQTRLVADLDNFSSLGPSESLTFSTSYVIASGTDTETVTLEFTVNGDNDAPFLTTGTGAGPLAANATANVDGNTFLEDPDSTLTWIARESVAQGGGTLPWYTVNAGGIATLAPSGIDAADGLEAATGREFELFLGATDGQFTRGDDYQFIITPDFAGGTGDGGSNYLADLSGTGVVFNDGAGNDFVDARGGDDTIFGAIGDDIIDGGAGEDLLSYSALFNDNLIVNMVTGTATSLTFGSDTFSNIENVAGGTGSDFFVANGDGVDNDFSDGTPTDFDVIDYSIISSGGVRYDGDPFDDDGFEDATVVGINGAEGDVGMDTLTRFESFIGTDQDDDFNGGYFNESVANTDGVDTLDGGDGIFDQLNFILGSSSIGVEINLATGMIANDGFGNAETAVNFEDIFTGDAGDTLTGDSNPNFLSSGAGSDVLRGNAGSDVLNGGSGSDTFILTDTLGGVDFDIIQDFEPTIDELDLSSLLTSFVPATDNLEDFVIVEGTGGTAQLFVDADGMGTGEDFEFLATMGGSLSVGAQIDIIFDTLEPSGSVAVQLPPIS
ncbi:MAG: tandem-95 repeat protein [Pseudomonadota bacterium]